MRKQFGEEFLPGSAKHQGKKRVVTHPRRSKSVGASASLIEGRADTPSPVRGRSLHRQMSSSPAPSLRKRKHVGPTGPRKGLRSLSRWPTPSRTPSPTGASPEQPIIINADAPALATPTVMQETRGGIAIPRKSLRLQAHGTNETILSRAQRRARGEGSGPSSGIPLVQSFPFSRLTTDQVLELFKVYHIQLGSSVDEHVRLITTIKAMDRDNFEIAITDILDRTKAIPSGQLLVVDTLTPVVHNQVSR